MLRGGRLIFIVWSHGIRGLRIYSKNIIRNQRKHPEAKSLEASENLAGLRQGFGLAGMSGGAAVCAFTVLRQALKNCDMRRVTSDARHPEPVEGSLTFLRARRRRDESLSTISNTGPDS